MHPLPIDKKIANAAPLGLCAFALTSFLTNCINLGVGNVQAAGASVSLALIYGGLVQILVGMWYVIRICGVSTHHSASSHVCTVDMLTESGKWLWEIHSAPQHSPLLVRLGSALL